MTPQRRRTHNTMLNQIIGAAANRSRTNNNIKGTSEALHVASTITAARQVTIWSVNLVIIKSRYWKEEGIRRN